MVQDVNIRNEGTSLVAQSVFKTDSGRIIPSVAGSIPALSAIYFTEVNMKKLKITLSFVIYLLLIVEMNSQTADPPIYNITTGKIPNILHENDIKRQFEIMELDDFIDWLKPQSKEITESVTINEERLTNLMINNYNMRKRIVTQELRRYHRPMLKYITHFYQKNWVKEWMVVNRIERNMAEEAAQELDRALEEMNEATNIEEGE